VKCPYLYLALILWLCHSPRFRCNCIWVRIEFAWIFNRSWKQTVRGSIEVSKADSKSRDADAKITERYIICMPEEFIRPSSRTFRTPTHAPCLTKATKWHVDIWQFSRIARQKPLTRVRQTPAQHQHRENSFSSGFSTTLQKFAKSKAHVDAGGGGDEGGWWWLVYVQILVGCTHFLPLYGVSTEPVARNQEPSQGQGRRTLPRSPCAKMFLLEFYFISLDFDGFIVCPGVHSNGVTAAS